MLRTRAATETEALGAGDSAFSLRRADERDNQSLLELTRACPMRGDVALRIDRSPDFFALSRCRGPGFTLVAEARGAIVGCASVARHAAYVEGQRSEVGYIGDVKVHPEYRRSGVARGLLDEIGSIVTAEEPRVFLGTTAAGNSAVDALLFRFGRQHTMLKVATFVSFQLLPLFRARVDDGLAIAPARPEDEEELCGLLDAWHRGYSFGPVFRDGGLRELLGRSPGMSLADYLVARRSGRLVAALGVWDQHQFKQTTVVRMTRSMRWVSALVRAGARPFGWPSLPTEGQPLRFCFVRHPCHAPGEVAALAALVRVALNAARERRDHFLLFTSAEGDPLARAVQGIPRTSYRYALLVGHNRPCDERSLGALAPAPVHDDASLA